MENKLLFIFTICLFNVSLVVADNNPKSLVESMVEASGGKEAFYDKRDVEYVYLYRDNKTNKIDLSVERYIFDGEISVAEYPVHEKAFMPENDGLVVQKYDGSTTTVELNGKEIENPEVVKRADFLRKTNYYWFAMMFKLLDPGLKYSYEGEREEGDNGYHIVKVGFEDNVGDVADTYVLYINKTTKLVDKFLFTVMDFGRTDPLLMEVEYDQVDGILLPTKRRYIAADWQGNIKGKDWVDEISLNVKFDNGFTKDSILK